MFVFNFQPITHTLLRQSRLQLKRGSDGSDKQILETDYAITPDDEQCCENKHLFLINVQKANKNNIRLSPFHHAAIWRGEALKLEILKERKNEVAEVIFFSQNDVSETIYEEDLATAVTKTVEEEVVQMGVEPSEATKVVTTLENVLQYLSKNAETKKLNCTAANGNRCVGGAL